MVRFFVNLSPAGPNIIKPFMAIIYEARVFVPVKPLQPSLMFAGKAEKAWKRLH
jgi:hypothetical protein